MIRENAAWGGRRWLWLTAVVTGLLVAAVAVAREPGQSTALVLVPHPDDEMQAWGFLEQAPAEHLVFAFLTLGEATGQCLPGLPGWEREAGERRPRPVPQGRWTPTCEEARVNTTVGFLEDMASTVSWLPSSYLDVGSVAAAVPSDTVVERCDEGADACQPPGEVRVFQGDGVTLLFFDLGDGDLSIPEVQWAARASLSSDFAAWLPDRLELHSVVGASYFNDLDATDGRDECGSYPHADHKAVRDALRDVDLGVAPQQAYPTCRVDPDTVIVAPLPEQVWSAAFQTAEGRQTGQHKVWYGWLMTPHFRGDGGVCAEEDPHCADVQQELFHRYQTFGVR